MFKVMPATPIGAWGTQHMNSEGKDTGWRGLLVLACLLLPSMRKDGELATSIHTHRRRGRKKFGWLDFFNPRKLMWLSFYVALQSTARQNLRPAHGRTRPHERGTSFGRHFPFPLFFGVGTCLLQVQEVGLQFLRRSGPHLALFMYECLT